MSGSHTGNILAAQTGATLRDLMTRMGHDDERAALIYQHASDKADQAIARGIDALVKAERKPDDGDSAAGVPVPVA